MLLSKASMASARAMARMRSKIWVRIWAHILTVRGVCNVRAEASSPGQKLHPVSARAPFWL